MSHRVRNGHINVSSVYSIPEEKKKPRRCACPIKMENMAIFQLKPIFPFQESSPLAHC